MIFQADPEAQTPKPKQVTIRALLSEPRPIVWHSQGSKDLVALGLRTTPHQAVYLCDL